ncbi:MAG: Hpt domain-containing protein [Acidobacteriota bacterium]|nr:Hpt domain-containing protein [Acidobacteriota bacterium]
MDTELLQGFIKQAESCLPKIRGGILVCAQEGNLYGELHTSLREIESLKSAAVILGCFDVANVSEELEQYLKLLVGSKEPVSDDKSRRLLDKLTELEVLLTNIHFSIDDSSENVADFVEESFGHLQLNPPSEEIVEALAETVETEEEFEIDDEMLEIFALEAEDIVRAINANLEILSKTPNSREALLEIRRNAHTLKGSAGIVGLKHLSDLAHRVEDLLDYLAEDDIESNEQIFELLLTSTDCFEALGNGESSAQLTKKIARTYQSFDEVITLLTKGETQETSSNPTAEISDSHTESANPKSQIPNPKSVVRVSLEKLDDLVNIVSGLIISRSVFEQRLGEFDRQIEELHNSTLRLQRSTNKLETDFSTDLLTVPNSKFQIQSSSFRLENPQSTIHNPQSFDALEFDRYTEFHQTTRELIETTTDTSAISGELHNLKGNLELLFDGQRRLIEEMQDKLLRLRMVSFGSLSIRLQRTVRVVCDEEGKSAELFIEGENLEVDTQILDALIEPLLHLLRNAVAHGIEPPETRRMLGKSESGKISLCLSSEGTHIVLTVADDGRGISVSALKDKAAGNSFISKEKAAAMTDAEAFELAFLLGLTTAEKLSQVSGRGVGLTIVKTGVARQQGTILIDSEFQKGTTFTIRLPMALAVTRAILVKANRQTFAFPLKLVKHITDISAKHLEKSIKSVRLGDVNYKVSHLNELLNMPISVSNNPNIPLLLLDTLARLYPFQVTKQSVSVKHSRNERGIFIISTSFGDV